MRIDLQTAVGKDVSNDQDAVLAPGEYQRFITGFRAKWQGLHCVLRDPALQRYNCHGLTFASRRTWIDNPDLIPEILRDDGYKEIAPKDVAAGDVIVYYDTRGRAEHSGLVVEVPPTNGFVVGMPRILSKWAKMNEVVHWANQCPYEVRYLRYYRLQDDTKKTGT